jgi:hypothetical protein
METLRWRTPSVPDRWTARRYGLAARRALTCQSELTVAELSVVLSQIWPTNPPGVRLPATVSAASR